jgi:3-hydroxybutyryl-CoA dehydrogenase
MSACDIIIEAVVEDISVKHSVLQEIERKIKKTTIIATNTSSLRVSEIAEPLLRKENIVGMHFFNPVPMMALVEIIRGLQTSDETHQAIYDMSKRLGKQPITVKNAPGFVVNRILVPMINEAFFVLAEGIASAEDAYARIRAGASLVQVYSALVYHGPGLALKINRQLLKLLQRDGFANISDAVGTDA